MVCRKRTTVFGVIDAAKPSSKFFGNQGNCPIRVPDFVNYYLLKLGGSVETLELLAWCKSRLSRKYRLEERPLGKPI
jgi:hypothetical protein